MRRSLYLKPISLCFKPKGTCTWTMNNCQDSICFRQSNLLWTTQKTSTLKIWHLKQGSNILMQHAITNITYLCKIIKKKSYNKCFPAKRVFFPNFIIMHSWKIKNIVLLWFHIKFYIFFSLSSDRKNAMNLAILIRKLIVGHIIGLVHNPYQKCQWKCM